MPTDAGYYRDWRAAHPGYRARERVRSGRRDRSAEYDRRREARKAAHRVPVLEHVESERSHPLLDTARAVALEQVRPDRRSLMVRPTFEDAVSEATLALLTGADAAEAVRGYVRSERDWLMHTAPLLDGLSEVAA